MLGAYRRLRRYVLSRRLRRCLWQGDAQGARALLARGAIPVRGSLPSAVRSGLTADAELMRRLFRSGAAAYPAGAWSAQLTSGLAAAIRYGSDEALGLLIGAGADPNARVLGAGLVVWAAAQGNDAAIRALLDAGAMLELTTMMGNTALEQAAALGFGQTVRLLLSRGARPGHATVGAARRCRPMGAGPSPVRTHSKASAPPFACASSDARDGRALREAWVACATNARTIGPVRHRGRGSLRAP